MDKQIANIKKHINNNCLSGIEPGHGSERNEHLHKLLSRSMIRGATIISYELAEAVLTVLFHNYSESKKETKHKCSSSIKIVKPMINYQDFNLYSNETAIGFRLNILSVSDLENVTEQNVALEWIYQNATHIFKGPEFIGKLCCRKGVSIIDHVMKKLQYTFGENEKNLDCNKTMTVADLGRNLSHFNKEIGNTFLVEDSFFHAFAQQWGNYYFDMDETLKELFRNNFAPDLLKTMFSREDRTISVELVKKTIQEELWATDHMTFSSFFVDKMIKATANLYQIHILVVSGACEFEFEFYPSCNPVMSKCMVLGIINESASKFYASTKDAIREG